MSTAPPKGRWLGSKTIRQRTAEAKARRSVLASLSSDAQDVLAYLQLVSKKTATITGHQIADALHLDDHAARLALQELMRGGLISEDAP